MKRLNPETGNFFKSGEYNPETGLYFRTYTKRLKKDGFFKESWLRKESFDNFRKAQAKSAKVWSKERYSENKKFIEEYKLKLGCLFCGFNKHPSALDFDHIDRESKDFNISEKYAAYTLSRIVDEINKCQVLCANCHRIKSYTFNEHKKIKPPKYKNGGVVDSRMRRDENRSPIYTTKNKSLMKNVFLSKSGTYFVRRRANGARVCLGSYNNAFDAACMAIKSLKD